MKKYAYLNQLEELLAELPSQQRQQVLKTYRGYFEQAGADQEEETAARLGTPGEAAARILHGEEEPLPRLAGHRNRWLLAALAVAILLALAVGLTALGNAPSAIVPAARTETMP